MRVTILKDNKFLWFDNSTFKNGHGVFTIKDTTLLLKRYDKHSFTGEETLSLFDSLSKELKESGFVITK